MTREEHIAWCKKRALDELAYYKDNREAIRNSITSMMSDINKHPETKSDTLQALCVMQMIRIRSRHEAREFIEGFR